MNVDTLSYNGLELFCWDVGGSDKIKSLWRHYYQNSKALIFVVDSSDRERMTEATYELASALREDELRDAVVLIFANKQDHPIAMSVNEVRECFRTYVDQNERKWHVEGCCAKSGEGLYEGWNWLLTNLDGAELLPDIKSKLGPTLNRLEEVKEIITSKNINKKDKQGNTYLMLASSYCNPSKEVLEYLLSLKADVNATNKYNQTALFKLCSNISTTEELIECLLSHKADLHINNQLVNEYNEKLSDKFSSLQACVQNINLNRDMLDLFIQYKEDFNVLDSKKNTLLHLYFQSNYDLQDVSLLKILLEQKIDVNAVNEEGETCLFNLYRSNGKYYQVVQLLLEFKIDLNIKSSDQEFTILQRFVKDTYVHDTSVVKLMLKGKADPNFLNKNKQSVVSLFFGKSFNVGVDILECFVEHKADFRAKYDNRDALSLVCLNQNVSHDVLRFMLEYNLDPNQQATYKGCAFIDFFANNESNDQKNKDEKALYLFLLHGANPFLKPPYNLKKSFFINWLKENFPFSMEVIEKFQLGKVGWSKESHHLFPSSIRRNIETLILCLKHFKFAHPPKPLVMTVAELMVDLYYCEKLRNYENEANKKL